MRLFSALRRVAVAALFTIAGAVLAAPGDLDPAFGSAGVARVNFRTVDSFAEARGVAVQADGKVVVVGDYYEGVNTHVAMVRYNTDGTLDSGFGAAGVVQKTQFGYEFVEDVTLQADGKIVVVGWNDVAGNDCFVARFNANGSIDTSFGGGGTGFRSVEFGAAGGQDRCYAVRIDASGNIVIAGYGSFGVSFERNIALARFTPAGLPDASFGTGGEASFDLNPGGTDRAWALAIQSDGKLVVAGRDNTANQAYVARFGTNGSIDTTFNAPNGFHRLSLGGTADEFRAIAIQPDGKIVAGGAAYVVIDVSSNRTFQAALARFNANGTLDGTFGSAGVAFRPIAGGSGQDGIRDLRVFDAGGGVYKILASGYTTVDWLNNNWNFFGARFNADGSFDGSWGVGGKRVVDMSSGLQDFAEAGAIGASGELFVGGYGDNGLNSPLIALLKLTPAGAADTTFNGTGKVLTQLQAGSNDQAGLVAVQSNGSVILAGATLNNNWDVGVARLTSAGVLDATFAGTGKTTYGNVDTSVYEYPSAVGVQSDGKILVAATIGTGFGLIRYNTNGTLDATFGSGGIASVSLGANGGALNGIAVQADGKIVAAGQSQTTPSNSEATVMRFNTNGTLDATFGTGGRTRWDYPGSTGFDEIAAVYLQADGKIIVAGRYSAGTYFNGAAARLTTAGALDPAFGTGGKATFSFSAGGTELYGIGVQLDGRIILAGKVTPPSSTNDSLVARLNTNGTLDSTFGGGAGYVVVPLSAGNDQATRALVRWDDKIVMVGSAFNGSNDDLGVAMLNQNGALDTTFTPTGTLLRPIGARNDYVSGFTIQQDGHWLIGGSDDAAADLMALRMFAPPHDPRSLALDAASDTGRFGNDRITNDATPSFSGQCFNFETVHLQFDGANVSPTSTCTAGFTFDLTVAGPVADGTYAVRAYDTNPQGTSSFSPAITVTIDTVALPPPIAAPVDGGQTPLTTAITGSGAETTADVVIYESGSPICTTQANAAGAWSCTATFTPGAHTIVAQQTDLAGNTSVNSAPVTFTAKRPTTTSAVSAPNPSTYGQPATFTATVVAAGAPVPTGTATFSANGNPFASGVSLDASGVALATTSAFAAGSYTITVDYSGDAASFPSASAPFVHAVSKAAQAITFGGLPGRTYGDAPFGVSASATSGLAVSFSSQTPATCTVAGATVTIVGAGGCTIRASQAGDSNWQPAPDVDQPFAVAKAAQTITFAPIPDHTFGGAPFAISATSSSGLAVTIASQTPAVCTYAGGNVTLIAAGVCTIRASQLGNANYNAAVDVDRTFNVQKGSQTIAFAAIPTHTLGDPPFGVSATASSGLAVSFGSLTPPVCTVSGSTVTIVAAGTCTIRASQPGDSNWLAAPDVDRSFAVSKTAQTITFAALPNRTYGDPPFAVSATASSGLAVAFASLTPQVCSVSAATVTIAAAGTCTIRASQAGDAQYAAAADVDRSFAVARVTTSVAASAAPPSSVFGQPVMLSATVSGGNAPAGTVTFLEGTTTVTTAPLLSGSASATFAPTVGAHAYTARYDGDGNHAPATSAPFNATVAKAPTALVLTPPTPVVPNVPATFAIAANAVAPGAGTPSGTVSIGDGTVSCTATLASGAGSCVLTFATPGPRTVTATYAGDASFVGSTQSTSVTVAPVTSFTGPTATGTGNATATISGGGSSCTFTQAQFVPVSVVPGGGSPGLTYPHGLFDFRLAFCTPGAPVTVRITYPSALPAGTFYAKYGPTPNQPAARWYTMPASVSGSAVAFTIVDGGLGDDDLASDGTIVDQGGPAVPASMAPIPTLQPLALALLALALGFAAAPLARRRR